ncbi:MAG: UDP-N-acetylmuramoyl-L-alanine--D-glutamate ligase [Armatimonadetes bacterium]|nr:UDP-N-acetylmuramoyl-L-alanine--D-glutamate ligase [Armatimonadota bacterium]
MASRWDRFREDTFLVVGFTELTGLAVATMFETHAIRYKISDLKPLNELRPLLARLRIAEQDVFCGPQVEQQLQGITKIVLSPGVPRSIVLIAEAVRRQIPVLGDVDFLYDLIGDKKIIAITGTDGKTTTTTLIAQILETGAKVVVAGNIGVPVFSKYDEILRCDFLVLEVSSFMLEDLQGFRPRISAVINIAQDHVDRYGSLEHYAEVKLNIIRHCTSEDIFIQNLDDAVISSFVPPRVQTRTVSRSRHGSDYFFADGVFFFRGQALRYSDCLLRGAHNIENILIAIAVTCEAGVTPHQVARAVTEFRGVPHRFQYLGRCRGVTVYDDSKATTVHAVEGALRSFHGNVVLIMGGRDKFLDFSPLQTHAHRVKHLVCYGEAGERIRDTIGLTDSDHLPCFQDAVARAVSLCSEGDVLLLSPGCTSWDQFPDYAARGVEFQQFVCQRLGHLQPNGRETSSG